MELLIHNADNDFLLKLFFSRAKQICCFSRPFLYTKHESSINLVGVQVIKFCL